MKGIFRELKTYSLSDIARMGWSFIMTKLFYPGAMLVRRPICIRQKAGFHYGRGLSTGRNCRIEIFGSGRIEMGERCQIGDNVHLVSSSLVQIGSDCLFASKVFVSDTSHGSYGAGGSSPVSRPAERPLDSDPVVIGDRVWLGESVVVLPGVTIGDGCIVGSGAVVCKSLPGNCVAVGVPAHPVKVFDEHAGSWVSMAHSDRKAV